MATLDLSRYDTPLEPVILPSGREAPVREPTRGMVALLQRHDTETDAEQKVALLYDLVRRCVPSITDAELDDLTGRQLYLVVGHCFGRLEEVVANLGNAGAPRTTPAPAAGKVRRPRRSPPTTSTTTP